MSEYRITLTSSILSGPTDLCVLVPNPVIGNDPNEFYKSGKKYKVLWLLHGGNGGCNDWLHYTKIALLAERRNFIVVMPNALNTDYANHPQFTDGYNYNNFFFDELMPYIHNWFPASDRPEDNIIAGYSMGAAAAWMFALQHPEKIGGIASVASALKDYNYLDCYREMSGAQFRVMAEANPENIPAGYGPPGAFIHQKEINMISKYSTVGAFLDSPEHTYNRFKEAAENGTLPKAYTPCGTEDRGIKGVKAFEVYAASLGADSITFEYIPGGGGYAFCDQVLPGILDFFQF